MTNDDGVHAPGLAALTRALVTWADAAAASGGPAHQIVVVAPSSNYSGAGAAVGSVTDRSTVSDSDPDEQARQMSISATLSSFEWREP